MSKENKRFKNQKLIDKTQEKMMQVYSDIAFDEVIMVDRASLMAKLKYCLYLQQLKNLYLMKYNNCNHSFIKTGENDYCCPKCGLSTKKHTSKIANPKYEAMALYFKLQEHTLKDNFDKIIFPLLYSEFDQTKKTK